MSAFREIFAHFGIEVDTSELKKGKESVEDFVETLKGVGEKVMAAFAVEKVKEFVMGMAEAAEKLELQAASLGVGTQALQEWQFAASMSGIKADQLTGAMMRLEKGGKASATGLQALGLSAKDAHGEAKPVTQMLDEIADKIEKIESPTKRAEAATKIFGKTGQKLIPFLEQGSKGIKKFRDEVKELGGGMSEDFIKKSKQMLQDSKRLNLAWESFKVRIVGELLPAFTTLITWLTKGAMWLVALSENSSMLTAAFTALGVAAVIALSSMLGPLGALLLELAPIIIGFLLIEDFITFLRGGDSEFGRAIDSLFGAGAGEKVRKWITDALQDFKDFIDAITGGNSDAAQRWRDDWELFQKKFIADTGDLGRIVIWFLKLFTGGWTNATAQVSALFGILGNIFSMLWHSFRNGWEMAIFAVQDLFSGFVNGFLEGAKLVLQGIRAIATVAKQTDMVAKIDSGLSKLQGSMMNTGHIAGGEADMKTEHDADMKAMLANADTLAGVKTVSAASMAADAKYAQENGTGTRIVEKKTDIHINVPAGTPHGVAHAAGEAAEEGVNRANAAALIPGDG